MKLYLLPPFCILLASCSTPLSSTGTNVDGAPAVISPHHTPTSLSNPASSGPYQVATPATSTGTTSATGGNAIQAVRGAREAASTVQVFRNLFGGF